VQAHSSSRLEANSTTVIPERRQLTVMFCDLVDSTALSARLDPEDLRDVIGAYRHRVADAVARFEGFIARYMGDGVLVYFGYPRSHEDNAERAVRAGLAAVAAVRSISTRVGIQLQARAGIATGVVIVGGQIGGGETQEVDVTGETPNFAARLQAAAASGEVVIATNTRRLIGRIFDCRSLGPIEFKGLPHPLEIWQVHGENAGVSRFDALHTGVLSPLVGRQEEIELLLRRWDQAKAGEGRVVLLSGEPGIGKSRIKESLLARLGPHASLHYFCSPYHTQSALYPFVAQIERVAGFKPDSGAVTRLDKLEALLKPTAKNLPRDLALLADLLAVPTNGRYPMVEVSPQQRREMTLTTLLNRLDGIAAQEPVLTVFEDAHWIDPTSLELLDRIVARVADLPVLLIITFRPEFQPTWVGQPHVTMMPLSRLGRRDGAALITGVTRNKPLPDGVVEQILARADGVPLFIEELTSTLVESGLLRRDTKWLRTRQTVASDRHADDATGVAGGPPRSDCLGQGFGADRRRDRTGVLPRGDWRGGRFGSQGPERDARAAERLRSHLPARNAARRDFLV
jgi:class 3 adenylate cyclase